MLFVKQLIAAKQDCHMTGIWTDMSNLRRMEDTSIVRKPTQPGAQEQEIIAWPHLNSITTIPSFLLNQQL